jgi:hypothetical protein
LTIADIRLPIDCCDDAQRIENADEAVRIADFAGGGGDAADDYGSCAG